MVRFWRGVQYPWKYATENNNLWILPNSAMKNPYITQMVWPNIQPLYIAAAKVIGFPNTDTMKSDDAKLNMITFWGVHSWKNKYKHYLKRLSSNILIICSNIKNYYFFTKPYLHAYYFLFSIILNILLIFNILILLEHCIGSICFGFLKKNFTGPVTVPVM